jgi:uncharacterized repeat protein (TIGR01451 family)
MFSRVRKTIKKIMQWRSPKKRQPTEPSKKRSFRVKINLLPKLNKINLWQPIKKLRSAIAGGIKFNLLGNIRIPKIPKINLTTSDKKRMSKFFWTLLTTIILTISFSGGYLWFTEGPARAATTIAIEPITWDFVGLDSNKPETQGPNTYVVGARVCNTGGEDALNVKVKFVKDGVDNGYAYIRLQAGDTYTFDRIPKDNGSTSIAAGAYVFDTRNRGGDYKSKYRLSDTPQYCQDFYYNFEVTRTPAAWQTYQKYYIEASASNAGTVRTERPRQSYIEQLISQARNEVFFFGCDPAGGSAWQTSTVTVQVGDTFTCQARAHTSTDYPQVSFTSDIPNVIFQVLNVNSTYSRPPSSINSTVYADGCGWVNNPQDPRYHLSPGACSSETGFLNVYSDQYPYIAPPTEGNGGVGNDIVTNYRIKVLAFPNGITNPITVSNIILDYSGSSYHYNSDYGLAPNIIAITVANPSPTDLSVTKTHSGNFSYGDNTYTLTVSDDDNTPNVDAKSPVTLTDTLPTGYTFKDMNATKSGTQPLSGANAANWNCDTSGQVMTCLYDTNGDSIGENFPDGGSNILTLNVNIANGAVPSGTTSTNFVRVALNTAQTDSNTANNTASDPTTVLAIPNLVLAKTSSPVSPTKFELGTASASYTLTATNSTIFNISGPLTLVDNLPTGITFNSVDTATTSAGWSCSTTDATKQNIICTNASGVASGANTQVTIKVDVSGSVIDGDAGTQGVQVTNKAVISTGSAETSLSDNQATITNEVNKPAPDLSIFKTDSNLDFVDNSAAYYYITVTNVGGLPTTGSLIIRDTLPEIFEGVTSRGRLVYTAVIDPATGVAPTNWTCTTNNPNAYNIVCTSTAGFVLAPGQSSTIRMEVQVPNLPNGTFNPVTNTATIDVITGEIITSNNTSSDTTNIVNSLTGNQSNLGIDKSVTTTPSGPGQNITYQLLIVNDDTNQNITKGLFEDIVPSQITGVTASCAVATGTGTYRGSSISFQGTGAGISCCTLATATDPSTGGTKVSCATSSFIQLLKKSGSNFAAVKITISGTASQSGTIYNGASVSIDPTDTVKDKDATDNYDSVSTPVPGPTLTLAKTPIPAAFTQGDLVTYRLTVTNPGSPNTLNSAGFLKITDPLPSQYTYISSTSASGSSGWQCEAVGQNVTCFNGTATLTPGQSTAVDLLLRVSGNGTNIINTATLTRPDGTTTTASNTQNITAAVPDLVITKTAANIAVGQQGTYTIKVQNIGTGKALAPIIVRDTLPPTGLTFVSGSGTGWSCITQTSPTVDPQVVICTNYSDIAGSNTFAPDLILNVLVSATASGNLSNTAKVNLAPDTLIAGETAFGNNTTTIITPVATISDLAVVKTAVDQDGNSGNGNQFYKDGTGVYNITITNNGPSAYSGTVTIDENLTGLPFTYSAHSNNTTWTCTDVNDSNPCASGDQNLRFAKTGGLLAGESSNITLTVNVPNSIGSNYVNTASINATTLTNASDPTGDTNDSDTETVNILDNTTTLTLSKDDNDGESPDEPTNADLQTKFVKGGIGKYTIVATNTGLSPAKAPVTISDTLPTGLTYAGNSQTANWSCTGTIGSSNFSCIYGIWTDTDNDGDRFDVGGSSFTQQELPSGTSSGVEIQVNVIDADPPSGAATSALSGGVYINLTTNSASVSGSNFTTVNASEDTAIIDPADLAVTKSIAPSPLATSGTGNYTITVTNNGPGTSYPQIYLQDYLPTGLTYTGATSGTALGDGSWTIVGYNSGSNEVTYKRTTALANAGTTTITLPVSVSASPPASVTNFVRVGGFTPEPDYDTVTPGYQDPKLASCDVSLGANQPVNNCFALTTPITGGVSTDLAIAKIQGTNNDNPPNPAVNFNTNYSYTLQVANISANNAETVTLTDVLPIGLDYVSYSIDGGDVTITNPYVIDPPTLTRTCSYASGTRTFSCNLLRVSTSENNSDPVDITLTVKSQVSGIVDNTATVTSVTADTNTTNNTESEKVLVNPGTGVNTISGKVFNDLDNGGPTDIDGGETGTVNVKVNLYQDTGTVNGAYDVGDTLLATTTTNATGDYSFTLGLTGTFIINIDTATLPVGHNLTVIATPTTYQVATFNAVPDGSSPDINNNFGHKSTLVPGLNLVKRITAINGTNITGFENGTDTTGSNDDDAKWPSANTQYLRGAIACNTGNACNTIEGVKPNDTIEYTIYFLSNGTDNLKNVKICDRIPTNTTFEPDTYATGKGILLGWNNTGSGSLADPTDSTPEVANIRTWLTNDTGVAADGDRGKFYSSAETLPATPCGGSVNTNGGVVVDLGSATIVPKATGSGTPINSYGFVRFNVKVN